MQAGSGYDFRRNLDFFEPEKGSYNTDVFTEEAVRIIRRHASENDDAGGEGKTPLFLYLAHQAVHSGNPDSPLQV